ncbi:hypothetical protein MKW98_013576 [Papaver atlanticum]|uniref:Uncharacterized protein n=1 Tax=Papaver atlanticum TaxID=357466 RepID=A0AAD4XQG9_9MAGN|nr:hypothetical protein MKW98_013576 [Papaver atlanticum]
MLAVRGLIFYKLFQQFFEEQSTSSLALFLKDFQPSDGGPGKRLQSLLWL